MKTKVVVPKLADRTKVIGKILGSRPNFVSWNTDTCCFTACSRCR